MNYIDALVLRDRDSNGDGTRDERIYAQHDANFNTTSLVTQSGSTASVVERYFYEPYGDSHALNPSTWAELRRGTNYDWRIRFQGLRFDATSGGMYVVRNRDYSVAQSRWVQVDPIRYADGMNFYQFVTSRPVTLVDPSGNVPIPPNGGTKPELVPKLAPLPSIGDAPDSGRLPSEGPPEPQPDIHELLPRERFAPFPLGPIVGLVPAPQLPTVQPPPVGTIFPDEPATFVPLDIGEIPPNVGLLPAGGDVEAIPGGLDPLMQIMMDRLRLMGLGL